jgi:Ca2+-binding EF-hand superfamily protein
VTYFLRSSQRRIPFFVPLDFLTGGFHRLRKGRIMQRLASLRVLSLAAGSMLVLALPAFGDAAPSAQPDAGAAGSRWFARWDKNGDGAIDRQEFEASRQLVFVRLDSDGNQLVSAAEWQAMRDKMRQRHGNASNDNAATKTAATSNAGDRPAMTARGQKSFQLADENGDQQISAAEWQMVSDRMFDRLDANKDGKLTADEMRARRGLAPVEPVPQ